MDVGDRGGAVRSVLEACQSLLLAGPEISWTLELWGLGFLLHRCGRHLAKWRGLEVGRLVLSTCSLEVAGPKDVLIIRGERVADGLPLSPRWLLLRLRRLLRSPKLVELLAQGHLLCISLEGVVPKLDAPMR